MASKFDPAKAAPDNLFAYLQEEMPRPFFENTKNIAAKGNYDKLQAILNGFEDLVPLTFATALALTVASVPEDKKIATTKKLLERLTAPDLAIKGKSFGTWAGLLRGLPAIIGDFTHGGRPTVPFVNELLISIAEKGERERDEHWEDAVRKRNLQIHTRGQELGLDEYARYYREVLGETHSLFRCWAGYGLGWAEPGTKGTVSVKFSKQRHAETKLLDEAIPVLIGSCRVQNARVAILLGESGEQGRHAVWSLSPFVIFLYPGSQNNLAKRDRVEQVFQYLDIEQLDKNKLKLRWTSRQAVSGQNEVPLDIPKGVDPSDAQAFKLLPVRVELDSRQQRSIVSLTENTLRRLRFEFADEPANGFPDKKLRLFSSTGLRGTADTSIIGDSGACIVVRAEGDSKWPVALKILKPGADALSLRLFRREREFLRSWSHLVDHLAQFYGSGVVSESQGDDGKESGEAGSWGHCPFFALSYAETNVRTFLERRLAERRDGTMTKAETLKSIARALYITERITHSLLEVYAKVVGKDPDDPSRTVHFLHRDVRPENLLYLGEGIIRLCDFNSAFLPELDRVAHSMGKAVDVPSDQFDQSMLSPDYCAPEIWDCPPLYSEKADVYSVGLVLNELLFGVRPNLLARQDEATRIYTDPSTPAEIDALGEIEVFAKRPFDPTSLGVFCSREPGQHWFNLKELVNKSTTRDSRRRWSMKELHDHVVKASRTLRAFVRRRCLDAIASGLSRGTAEALRDSLASISEALGHTPKSRLLLKMVRCEECYDEPGRNDLPCNDENISRAGLEMDKEVAAAWQAMAAPDADGAAGLSPEGFGQFLETDMSRFVTDADAARRILVLAQTALSKCPGLVDLSPGFIRRRSVDEGDGDRAAGGLVGPTKAHEAFRAAADAWAQHAGRRALEVVAATQRPDNPLLPSAESDEPLDGEQVPVLPPESTDRPRSLAEALLHFIVTFADQPWHTGAERPT